MAPLPTYVAGHYHSRRRLRHVADRLSARGVEIISTWLTRADVDDEQQEAETDLAEVRKARLFLLDTEDESITGGREVELGYALACGARTVRIGPQRNIFHHLVDAAYPTWEDYFIWEDHVAHL